MLTEDSIARFMSARGRGVGVRDVIKAIAPAALVIVGPKGPCYGAQKSGEPRRNHAEWPVRLARTTSVKDTVTTTYNRDPWVEIGTLVRVWCLSVEHRDRLMHATADMIQVRAEQEGGNACLMPEWIDLGPDLDLGLLELEIADIARRQGSVAWSDEGLMEFAHRVLARAQRMAAAGRGRHVAEALEAAINWELERL